jgi:aarF domain-containing kinase
MSPGPAYNFLCVLSSVADILTHAARIRAAQAAVSGTTIPSVTRKRRKLDPQVSVGKLAGTETASVDPAVKEEAIQRDVDLRKSNFGSYTATSVRSLLQTSELPDERVLGYERSERLIPESQPREGSLETTNFTCSKAFEPEVPSHFEVSISV